MEYDKIHKQDCLSGMKQLPNDYVDVTVTSPPYNAGSRIPLLGANSYEEYQDKLSEEEYYEFIKNTIKELLRINKHYVFFNYQLLATNKNVYLKIMNYFRNYIKEIIIWNKTAQPAMQPTCLNSAFEFVLVLTKKEERNKRSFERAFFNNRTKNLSSKLNSNVIYGNNSASENNTSTNKAVFPEYLVEWFIKRFTDINDVVFDPFMGSGTTAYVAKKYDRRFLGFEIDQGLIDYTNKRLEKVMNQTKIGEWFI